MQQPQSLLEAERFKEKLGKQDFHYDMEVFEPFTAEHAEATGNQKQNQIQIKQQAEKPIQALRDSTQSTTQAIENQTKAIQQSSDILNKLQKSINEGLPEYDALTTRNNQYLTNLGNSNLVDSYIVKNSFQLSQ